MYGGERKQMRSSLKKHEQRTSKKNEKTAKKSKLNRNNTKKNSIHEHTLVEKMQRDGREQKNSSTQKNQQRFPPKSTIKKPKNTKKIEIKWKKHFKKINSWTYLG